MLRLAEKSPDDFNIPKEMQQPAMLAAWNEAINELAKMSEAKTPQRKLEKVGNAI